MKDILTTQEAANQLGISRVEVFNRIKRGIIPATRRGRRYLIRASDLQPVSRSVTAREKQEIQRAVTRTVKEYGPALKLLGLE